MKETEYRIDDNEMSFLAIYFSLALDKLRLTKSKKNIIIVCSLGTGGAHLIHSKIKQKYESSLGKVKILRLYELNETSILNFDAIITTDIIKNDMSIPVIYMSDLFVDLQDERFDRFFLYKDHVTLDIGAIIPEELFIQKLQVSSSKSAIIEMIERAQEFFDIDETLLEYTLERESLSSTAYGNFVAIPHPIKACTNSTFLAIMVLDKSVDWQGKQVKFIFLFSPEENKSINQVFNNLIAQFILSDECFSRFIQTPTYDTFIENFQLLQLNQ